MTELEVVEKYSKICYDYNSAIWFDDTLYEDWPNIAMILTDEQYEFPEFSEECFVAGFYCKDNQVYILKDCSEGDYKEKRLSRSNPEFQELILNYISENL